ncbi:Uncharacterised protein [Mycobacteroides abscessus subsp. abscessus]|nr:Uncharacterised protein [Mycobacteroides abscessus subsp. abscessus]
MLVPTTARVSGPMAATKMMNGMGRKKLMITFSTLKTGPLASSPPRRVRVSSMPRVNPTRPPTSSAAETR